mmetsp:Transcript_6072/g.17012  ORF Transcript_6072/g.17012 Transcript_6072/m.17012 type:complete len:439 (+) Transcript_6072:1176-2492(+)
MSKGRHGRFGVVGLVPAAVLQQRQRQRTDDVGRRTDHPAQRLGIPIPLLPVIAGAGFRPRRLVLQLGPLQFLAIELIPRHRPHLLGDDGGVALPVGGDEELHRFLRGQDLRPLDAVDARDGGAAEAPVGAGRARLGIPVEAVAVAAHPEDVGGLVDGDVDVVLDDGGTGRAGLVELELVEAEVDGPGDGAVVGVEVAGHGDGQGGRAAEAGGGGAADVQEEVGVGDAVGNVVGGDLRELGIAAVTAVGQLGRADEQAVLDGDDAEGFGPEPAHPGEDLVLDEVDLGPVRGRPLRFQRRRVEAYAHGLEDVAAVAVVGGDGEAAVVLQPPCLGCCIAVVAVVAVSVLVIGMILVAHDVVGIALDAGAPIVGRFRLDLVELPADRRIVFAVQPSDGVNPTAVMVAAGRRGGCRGSPKGAAAATAAATAAAAAGGGIHARR